MKKSIIQKIFPFDDLKETVLRFPLSVLCALSIFVISILVVHEIISGDDEALLMQIIVTLGCCYLWFGISTLMAESQSWGKIKYLAVSFVGAGAIAALIFLSSLWVINLIFIIPALLLTLMVAPYLKGGNDISVWFFNRTTWAGVIVSYLAIILFAGGVSVALWAVQALFDVDMGDNIYIDMWLFAAFILGPIYALSWVPKNFEFSDDDCSDPAGLKFIVNWIAVPMALVYLLILYAYFIKIIATGELPNGHLAYMITGFAGVGIITYLVAYPLRNEGSFQLKLFYKIFFPSLLIPVGFHFYAIWERISAYGITEQRYLLLISAVWLLLMALSNTIGRMPIKAIPASLAILMIFASFGSWGGVSASGYSQTSRLESLLTKNDLLVDGKVVKSENEISFKDRKSISSILDYLCRSNRDDMIKSWFSAGNNKNWKCLNGSDFIFTKQLGFDYVSKYERKKRNDDRFVLNFKKDKLKDIKGYDFFVGYRFSYTKAVRRNDYMTLSDGRKLVLYLEEGGLIKFESQEDDAIIILFEYDLNKLVEKNNYDDSMPLVIDIDNDKVSARIYVDHINGEIKDDKPITSSISFELAFTLKE